MMLSSEDMGGGRRSNLTCGFCRGWSRGRVVGTNGKKGTRRGKPEGVGDIFIWHATRLHPSFINWRSRNEHGRQHPSRHTASLPYSCLAPVSFSTPWSLSLSLFTYFDLTLSYSMYKYIPSYVLAETANEDLPFLTFEHSSSSRSRPHINLL